MTEIKITSKNYNVVDIRPRLPCKYEKCKYPNICFRTSSYCKKYAQCVVLRMDEIADGKY